ncbi:hypothetical protein EYF80_066626 [Liparis tanakae]|uniref:Uncharacterized protein n=1 Tax=Liparis tanakae TaxID=230148 RepID=A0A4Z2E3A6_9TELE|nr:hypothetical protein EYF80_066626 [Liparis tanakae]
MLTIRFATCYHSKFFPPLSPQVSMALTLSSPCGYTFDEDEEMAVFESTAAEHGGPSRPRLPEISVISPGLDTRPSIADPKPSVKPAAARQGSCDEERVKVFLRIRPLTEAESQRGEEQVRVWTLWVDIMHSLVPVHLYFTHGSLFFLFFFFFFFRVAWLSKTKRHCCSKRPKNLRT